MRPALAALVLVAVTACGSSVRQTHRPAAAIRWPAAVKATRAHWYRSLGKAPVVPVTLSKGNAERSLERATSEAGVSLVESRYDPRAGGSAELVVEPHSPVPFAEAAGTRLTPLLRPLAHGDHAYLVTVVDAERRPLLVLGWTPGVGGGSGEGIAWQADGIHSSAIVGQPVTMRRLGDRVMAGPATP
jgi:hypothetical protein